MLKTRDNLLFEKKQSGFIRLLTFLVGFSLLLAPVSAAAQSSIGKSIRTNSKKQTDEAGNDSRANFRLENFEIYTDGSVVSVEWLTSGESKTLGFNLYREENGVRELLNSAPIAGSMLRTNVKLPAAGGNYRWYDKKVEFSAAYYLEVLDIDGNVNTYGPAMPSYKDSFSGMQPESILLTDLTKAAEGSTQRDVLKKIEANIRSNGKGNGNTTATPTPTPNATPTPTPTPNSTPTPTPTPTQTSSAQWNIAASDGVKISVNHDGWYRVSAQQLQNAGFNLNSNAAYWQLFADAAEQPIKVSADGSIEFFGRGLDTPVTDTKVYYLVNGSTAGKRLATSQNTVSNSTQVSNFDSTAIRKDHSIYHSGIFNGEAENWFGPLVTTSGQTFQDLNIAYADTNGGVPHLSVKLQGLTNVQHYVNIRFNNLDLGTVSFSNQSNPQFEFDLPASSVLQGTNRVTLQAVGSSSDYSFSDTVSLGYKKLFKAQNNRLRFTAPAGKEMLVDNFTETGIRVFELQGGSVSRELSVTTQQNNGTYAFTVGAAAANRELLAVAGSQIEQAAKVERNTPSAWNNSANKADFVIISPESLQTYAQELANRRAAQGLNTKVVAVEDIYDEFSFGARSPQAIKDFLKLAVANWQIKPQYVLLFGDSSFDMRNYLGQSNRDLIPTKLIDTEALETASDTWFVDFDNDYIEDIPLGRLPVGNGAEAARMLDKLARYDQQAPRAQKSGVFVADYYFEATNQQLRDILPSTAQGAVINRSAMTDAQMQQEIISKANQNPLFVVYTGHGTTSGWTNMNVFNTGNSTALSNSQLSFYMIVGCMNGYSHDAYGESLAEALLKADNGAIGVWASSGSIFASGPTAMSPVVTDKIFNSTAASLRIGQIVRLAKQATADLDTKRTYEYFGDPTVFVK